MRCSAELTGGWNLSSERAIPSSLFPWSVRFVPNTDKVHVLARSWCKLLRPIYLLAVLKPMSVFTYTLQTCPSFGHYSTKGSAISRKRDVCYCKTMSPTVKFFRGLLHLCGLSLIILRKRCVLKLWPFDGTFLERVVCMIGWLLCSVECAAC